MVNMLTIFGGGEIAGSKSVQGVESCKVLLLGWHFLFTSSGNFAVGCII